MTTTEHLQRIKSECERLLAIAETGKSFALSVRTEKQSMAGWRSTIAAIEWLETAYLSFYKPEQEEAERVTSQILAAWPIELLTQ